MKRITTTVGYISAIIFSVFLISCKKHENESTLIPVQVSKDVLKTEELVTEKNRFALKSEWLADTRYVAEKTKDEQALKIVSFIENNSVLSEPVAQGVKLLEEGKSEFWFSLVPITVGDNSLGSVWNKYYQPYESGGIANFQPDVRGLVLKSHIKVSKLWHGIILLHEGRHAYEFLTRQYNWKDIRTYCNEERDTHDFQNRITERLGGHKYDQLIEMVCLGLLVQLDENGYQPGEVLLHRNGHYPILDEIFGPCLSDLERDFRETSIWIHANFRIIENTFGADAPDRKSLFLMTLYMENGSLPN